MIEKQSVGAKQKSSKWRNISNGLINVILIVLLFICVIVIPVSAANTSWNMTMNYSVCDGSANKIYYVGEKKDTVNITGNIYVYSLDEGHSSSSIATYCYLYRKKIIGYEKICYQKLDTFYDVGDSSVINMTATVSKKSKKYFMYCYKNGDDGFNLKGSGNITFGK